jgi:hypothetical protein
MITRCRTRIFLKPVDPVSTLTPSPRRISWYSGGGREDEERRDREGHPTEHTIRTRYEMVRRHAAAAVARSTRRGMTVSWRPPCGEACRGRAAVEVLDGFWIIDGRFVATVRPSNVPTAR